MPKKLTANELAADFQEDQYNQKPIENFGMNMLESMGFSKQKGIGKSNKNSLKDVLVLKPRPKGLGLGAQQQKQKQKDPFSAGDYVLITDKDHKDLTGIILEVKQNNLQVQLFKSRSQIQISKSIAKVLTSNQVKELEEIEKKEHEGEQQKKKRLKWVIPGLRLKIVDKNSSLYLKKVIVHDLISDRQFQCVYDGEYGKEVIRNLRQKDVQTVIPKSGEPIMILKGQHKGQKARIFNRDKKNQKITVQTFTELELVMLKQDDICQFVEL